MATPVVQPDGRIAWPEVMQYHQDDKITNCPPMEGNYQVIVYNLKIYDELVRSGQATATEHTGRHFEIIDNRKGPT